ncbi:MAG: hypothetical protein F6K19_48800, partial [Cyanothece sp. SIO1E1]|nr:hypothetical protein [Cyanothece sp. SIO1E1]
FGRNIYPALFTLGYTAAGVHYQTIIQQEGAFPILNLYGDPGSGKTSAAECALSLIGMAEEGMLKDISLSAAYERLKLAGSLLHCLDDPKRTPELDEFLKGFYNGKARVVRGKEVAFNIQRPHSPMMVTSNHACGESSAATQSRLIRLWFGKADDGDRQAFYELPAAQKAASGCLTQLIKLGYPAEEIHQIETYLMPFLPYAHIRIAKSLALILYYAEQVAQLARVQLELDLRDYVVNQVCRSANDVDESGDSLRDFFEKVSILQSQSQIGDWNIKWIHHANNETVKSLAFHLPGVWSVLDREFDLAYNRKVIERLLKENGAQPSTQKFHANADVSKAFHRGALDKPEWQARRCIEIPVEALKKYSDMNSSTELTSLFNEAESQPERGTDKLTNQLTFSSQVIKTCEPGDGAPESTPCDSENVTRVRFTDSEGDFTPLLTPELAGGVLTAEVNNQQGVEGDLAPRLTELTEKIHPLKNFSKDKSSVTVEANLEPISPPPQVGDQVLVKGVATWIRTGSDKLPWKQVPKKMRNAAEVPIACLDEHLFHHLMNGGRVLSRSKDGERVKIRNPETGRTSVFPITDVVVLPSGGQINAHES